MLNEASPKRDYVESRHRSHWTCHVGTGLLHPPRRLWPVVSHRPYDFWKKGCCPGWFRGVFLFDALSGVPIWAASPWVKSGHHQQICTALGAANDAYKMAKRFEKEICCSRTCGRLHHLVTILLGAVRTARSRKNVLNLWLLQKGNFWFVQFANWLHFVLLTLPAFPLSVGLTKSLACQS